MRIAGEPQSCARVPCSCQARAAATPAPTPSTPPVAPGAEQSTVQEPQAPVPHATLQLCRAQVGQGASFRPLFLVVLQDPKAANVGPPGPPHCPVDPHLVAHPAQEGSQALGGVLVGQRVGLAVHSQHGGHWGAPHDMIRVALRLGGVSRGSLRGRGVHPRTLIRQACTLLLPAKYSAQVPIMIPGMVEKAPMDDK